MKRIKIGLDLGHNCPPDIGADGVYRDECELVREVGGMVAAQLIDYGYELVMCQPGRANSINDSLKKRVDRANSTKCDYFVSIHFNASNTNAHGTECFAISATGRAIAKSIVDKIAALGYRNRGVKSEPRFYVIRHTRMPAVLVECCFCDNKQDMDRYNAAKMSVAIADGLHLAIEAIKR